MRLRKKNFLLSVAGYDPSSGAGVTLDLKVFGYLGFPGAGILTSLTAQNTVEVREVRCLPPEFLWTQYRTLAEDVSFAGIKIGAIGGKKNMRCVARILSENEKIPRVLDPVFKSSSGARFLEDEAISQFIHEFTEKATILTPNLEEAAILSGIEANSLERMKEAAEIIFTKMRVPCLIKGGHLPLHKIDILFDGQKFHFFENRLIRKTVHGTGCFYSSALLAFLVKGNSLLKSCDKASRLTHEAIKKALKVGKGQNIIFL